MAKKVGLIITIALALSGIAYAAIPDSGGVIHSCYKMSNGALRVIDSEAGQACISGEVGLNWNQTGPQGPQGEQGPAGPNKLIFTGEGGGGRIVVSPPINVPTGQAVNASATCAPYEEAAISGGFEETTTYAPDDLAPRIQILGSRPFVGGPDPVSQMWFVRVRNISSEAAFIRVYAICFPTEYPGFG